MTTWLNDQAKLEALCTEIERFKAKLSLSSLEEDHWREAWKARGRDLNQLYDVINEVAGDHRTMDPVADLRALKAERDWLEQMLVKALDLLEKWEQAGRLHSA